MIFLQPKIEILLSHQGHSAMIPSDSLLFFLKDGRSKLRNILYTSETNSATGGYDLVALTLDDTPLVQLQASGCPTCESLLAAGYGLSAASQEIRQVVKSLTMPYKGLENALERLAPIIGLLMPGAYTLTSSAYFPTDGSGHFFWDVPSDFTSFKATAECFDAVNFRRLPCFPCFLYPSQPTVKYDQTRVDYYRAQIRAKEPIPFALAYAIEGYLSVLLDGHHRASACALEGVRLPCLTISPAYYSRKANGRLHAIDWPSGENLAASSLTDRQERLLLSSPSGQYVQRASTLQSGNIFSDTWQPEYQEAAKVFPTCEEASALVRYPFDKISPEGIQSMIDTAEDDETETAVNLLHYLLRQKGIEHKQFALQFAGSQYDKELRKAAFQFLNRIKNDPEIEDFFIDFLVYCDDKSNPLRRIADNYWNAE